MVKRLFLMAMGIALSVSGMAQSVERWVEFGLEYTTELQTDFKRAKWVNLLRTDLSVGLVYRPATESRGTDRQSEGVGESGTGTGRAAVLSLRAATLSTAQTDERPLIDDLQGFSNIEAENIPLTLAVLSLDWETEYTTLSVGIRNFNENYFATDLTSFFTQSSHGIFPTIAANFPIANYPVASLGMDFQWRVKAFTIDASVYNGVGYRNFAGRENLFRFCPRSDGVFGALQLSHEADYGNSHVGVALRGTEEKTRAALWAYTELNIAEKTQLLAQYSIAPGGGMECKQHACLGVKQIFGKVEIGVAENFARFAEADEWATELTASVTLGRMVTLQPTVHICRTGNETGCVGMLRATVAI